MVKIFIDAGHGGTDPGAVGYGLKEKELTLKIAKKIQALLGNYQNVSVKMSRTGDSSLTLKQRTDAANAWGADFFLSVHINAGGGTGYEDYRYNALSTTSTTGKIQAAIHDTVMAELKAYGVKDRGAKSANFHVLRESNMSAALSENLFIDTKADADLLKQDTVLDAIARGHVAGLTKVFNLIKKGTNNPAKTVISPSKTPAKPSVVYEAHVQGIGWQGKKKDGQTAGTTGQSKRLEALTVKLENTSAELEMEGHVQKIGWTNLRTDGEVIGTIGESLRLEAVKIKAKGLDIQYRVHVEKDGWTAWKKNGTVAGTTGQSKRIEAIQIKIA
jgi:N-acetylmuramoyl-L-alanine amidase/Clostridial hydrophobic W